MARRQRKRTLQDSAEDGDETVQTPDSPVHSPYYLEQQQLAIWVNAKEKAVPGASSCQSERQKMNEKLQCKNSGCSRVAAGRTAKRARSALCNQCAKAERVYIAGKESAQRFCANCKALHPLSSFDGTRRSCRATLSRSRCKRNFPNSRVTKEISSWKANGDADNASASSTSEPQDFTGAEAGTKPPHAWAITLNDPCAAIGMAKPKSSHCYSSGLQHSHQVEPRAPRRAERSQQDAVEQHNDESFDGMHVAQEQFVQVKQGSSTHKDNLPVEPSAPHDKMQQPDICVPRFAGNDGDVAPVHHLEGRIEVDKDNVTSNVMTTHLMDPKEQTNQSGPSGMYPQPRIFANAQYCENDSSAVNSSSGMIPHVLCSEKNAHAIPPENAKDPPDNCPSEPKMHIDRPLPAPSPPQCAHQPKASKPGKPQANASAAVSQQLASRLLVQNLLQPEHEHHLSPELHSIMLKLNESLPEELPSGVHGEIANWAKVCCTGLLA